MTAPIQYDEMGSDNIGNNNPEQILNDQEKDLGVIVDDELKFHMHTSSAIKMADQML